MEERVLKKEKFDPSDIKQTFADIKIDIHCCRYWKLSEWECKNMDFPFWRLYYNTIDGAYVYYNGKEVKLTSENIVIIPPETAFSTHLKNNNNDIQKESILGKKIEELSDLKSLKNKRMVDHLFIHFNLGKQFDSVEPDIYTFPIDANLFEYTKRIKVGTLNNLSGFDFFNTAIIDNLILNILIRIPKEKWFIRKMDFRVIKAERFIENNLHTKLSNELLARQANMAVNSFLRLFTSNTGFSIQKYIQNKRIEMSLILLHHTNDTIDEIAEKCGFCDRFHFSKIFKKKMQFSPSYYRTKIIAI